MKSTILTFLSLVILPLSAQEEKKEPSPAEQLLEVMEFKKTIIEGGVAAFPTVAQSLQGQGLNKQEMAEVKDAFTGYMTQLANDPALMEKTVKLYEDTFTNDELLELIAFYQTPTGRKTIHTLPEIMGKATMFSEKLAQKHVGSFQKALGDILERKAAREEKEDK
jgi:hypothetical protein